MHHRPALEQSYCKINTLLLTLVSLSTLPPPPAPPRLRATSAYSREMYALTEAVWRRRQYLLGSHFIIYTNHQSLRSLMHQNIQTPEQHK